MSKKENKQKNPHTENREGLQIMGASDTNKQKNLFNIFKEINDKLRNMCKKQIIKYNEADFYRMKLNF